jgi:polyisoprenoid-binding protein YceI
MENERWAFDLIHSSVQFSVRYGVISRVRGRFAAWTGSLVFDGRDHDEPTARFHLRIHAASITTDEPRRDAHLQSPDFLNVDDYPTIELTSAPVAWGDDRPVSAELTIHGVTRPVALGVRFAGRLKDPWGIERIGFSARAVISRKDFGLAYRQDAFVGHVAIGDKVEISIELEAVKSVAQAA